MNKTVLYTLLSVLGAFCLIIVGAFTTWAIMKPAAVPPPVAVVTPAPAPAPAAPAPTPGFAEAQVINVQPHYVTRTISYRVCHDVERTGIAPPPPPPQSTGTGAVVGGLAGGLAGSAFGHGHGKIATAVGGALLGALAGNAVENSASQQPPQPYVYFKPKCRLHYEQKSVQSGYIVTYTYNGQQGTIIMQTPPTGTTIPLSLTPVNQ